MERGADAPLAATGERLMPALQHGELVHAEHLARYRLAAELAEMRRVLDAACGEGYGTGLIAAAGARSVTGVDLDERTIAHAQARYPTADFVLADVRKLPFDEGAFDLVVSFETIEHVRDPEHALDEMCRVLTDDGLLLISTPNKHQYLVENEFHEREFLHEEFIELLSARFETVSLLLQHNWLSSAVLPPEIAADAGGATEHELRLRKVAGIEPGGELYTVALCGSGDLPALRPLAVAAKVDEAQELARRTVEAERAAASWHEEYKTAEQTAQRWHAEYKQAERTAKRWHDEYQSILAAMAAMRGSLSWRLTKPLRLPARIRRRRRG